MVLSNNVNDIITYLQEAGVIEPHTKIMNKMNGTTDGLVYTLTVNEEPKYVLKLDNPVNIGLAEQFHLTYRNSTLLPRLHYTDPARSFNLYAYSKGTTHYNRGSKIHWLTLLVKQLLNHYDRYDQTNTWGRIILPRQSWREFNEISVESARSKIGNVLPSEDYYKVKALIARISEVSDNNKFLLHGDTGVHNFMFHESVLHAVIDPSLMVGPVIYDFTYAFCSSPDDLNLETLLAAFGLLQQVTMDQSRLIEEVIVQLYCRIGICVQVHPHDLEGYLKGWEYWKALLT
ncbi:aminoglycoside phosphotransferase family protein [Paenibacillus kobensis]|uniref:phosphotransferase n=1 Tax=Paenibacillus kobensis TaxID=59841 RepID=UPI001FE860FF|nr:phosphotransferase [Paenibacillus kobensis]